MKAVLSFLLGLFISFFAEAQTSGYFDMSIEKSAIDPTVIIVKVTPTTTAVATAGSVLLGLSFTITWPSSYVVDLSTPTIVTSYGIQALGVAPYTTGSSGVNFRSFGLANPYTIPTTWAVGTPIEVMRITAIQNVATTVVGDFSINPFNNVLVPTPYLNLSTEPYLAIDDAGTVEYYEPALMGVATSVVLPLELLTFDAKAGKDAIDLRWKTAKEENFRGFNIERSLDGKKYTSVAFQAGKNAKGADYTFTDRNVVNGQVYYYRLRMIDNDGKNSVSDIRSAVLQGAVVASTGVNIYPNPTNGDVNLDFILDADTHTVVDLFDVTGKNVLHKEVEAKRDRNIISLEMLNMASGIYAVRINMGGKITNKLVKVAKQ